MMKAMGLGMCGGVHMVLAAHHWLLEVGLKNSKSYLPLLKKLFGTEML